jgi:FkbM family methyltransferase
MSIVLSTLKENDRLKDLEFTIGIVGSRQLSPMENQLWQELAPQLTIYGFDADEEACDAANQSIAMKSHNWTEKHIPLILSKSLGEQTLYITNAVHCSSLYEPNAPCLDRFSGMNQGICLDFQVEVETTTLDYFCATEDVKTIDFLKVDVQGADLDVLQGASELLNRSMLGILIEVEFTSLYKDQPLFADIDVFLRNQGFCLIDLRMEDAWCRRPRSISPIYSSDRNGQLLWADALYVRDPLMENAHIIMTNPRHILKLACLVDLLGYPDYALELLHYLTIHYGHDSSFNLAVDILKILSTFPQLIEQGLESLTIVQQIKSFLD